MADNVLLIEVEIDGKKGFAKLNTDALKAGEKAGGEFGSGFASSMSSVFAGNILANIVLKAASKIASALKAPVEAAAQQEDAINRLNNALARTGQFSKTFSESMQEFASGLQNTSRYADEAILSGAALLQTIGKLDQSQLKNATQAAVDLAAAFRIDLETAFSIVGKAAEGNVGQLGRLGIEVKKGATDAETFANALTKIGQAAGGAGLADLNTFAGASAKITNAFDEVLESIGNFIIKSPAIITLMNAIGDAFIAVAKAISGSSGIKQFVNDFIVGMIAITSAINDVFGPVLVGAGEAANFLFNALKTGVLTILTPVMALNATLSELFAKLGIGSEEAATKAAENFQSIKSAAVDSANATADSFSRFGEGQVYVQQLRGYLEELGTAAADTNTKVTELGNKVGTDLPQQAMTFAEAWKAAIAQTTVSTIQFAKAIQTGLVNGISNGFAAVGRSLVSGQNGFKEFGKAVLSTLGSLAIQLGQFFILVGTGMTATGALLGLSGSGAIAAGIGLTVLGGILQALGGGGGENAGVGNAGAGAIGGGGGTGSASAPEAFTGVQRGTEVVINVQGNVLDRRESGLEIASVLQEYFDTNNGVLART